MYDKTWSTVETKRDRDEETRESSRVDRNAFRGLPPVNAILEHETLAEVIRLRGRVAVLRSVRAALDEARSAVRSGGSPLCDPSGLAIRALEFLAAECLALRPVINATGILLHTGLGRAPLAKEAIEAVASAASGYCNLEFELESGERGRRTMAIERLLIALTGAAAATAVNNNAGATVLALRALARGREVIVSRGQLVEIGGSFRLPEIFEVSGARLREVGTTNKTRVSDYANAIGPDTAAIMRVHPSNFRIVGFTEEVPIAELAQLAHAHGLCAIDDIGSGSLRPGFPPRVDDEPTVAQGIAAGADVVLFSGDKLLGGPQCGILVGTANAIGRILADPLMRALRLDKMTLAALEATLQILLDGDRALRQIPLWRMIAEPVEHLAARARVLATTLNGELGLSVTVEPAESYIGGGSTPDQAIPTVALVISGPFRSPHDSAGGWAQALRIGDPAVVPRIHKGAVVFDLRTVLPDQDDLLLDAIRAVCHHQTSSARPNGVPGPVGRVDHDVERAVGGREDGLHG